MAFFGTKKRKINIIVGGPRVETPPPGENFRPILDRSISYPNPKLTCYAKIQCRLQELWPLESHSVKTNFFEEIFF